MAVPVLTVPHQPIKRRLMPDLADPSLVGSWLNWRSQEAEDYSPYGHDGAPTAVQFGGDSGRGAYFDGVASEVIVPDSVPLSPVGMMTVSCWIRKAPGWAVGAAGVVWKHSYNYVITCRDTGQITVQGWDTDGDVSNAIWLGVDDDRWYFLVSVFDGSRMQLYVDGVWRAQGNVIDNLRDAAGDLFIGVRGDYLVGQPYFLGDIADVRIYNGEAKSLSWMQREFQRGVPDDSLLLSVLDGMTDRSRYTHALTRIGGVIVGSRRMLLDGTDDRIDCGDLGDIETISMWVRPGSATEEILLVDAANDIMVNAGVVTYTGLTPVATYVNGVATTALAAGVWQHLVCVVQSIDANNFELGWDGANYGETEQSNVRVYSEAKTAQFARAQYLRERKFY